MTITYQEFEDVFYTKFAKAKEKETGLSRPAFARREIGSEDTYFQGGSFSTQVLEWLREIANNQAAWYSE